MITQVFLTLYIPRLILIHSIWGFFQSHPKTHPSTPYTRASSRYVYFGHIPRIVYSSLTFRTVEWRKLSWSTSSRKFTLRRTVLLSIFKRMSYVLTRLRLLWMYHLSTGSRFTTSLYFSLQRLKDGEAAFSTYDPQTSSIIKLSNGIVLYLREINKYLALVGILRNDKFDKQGDHPTHFQHLALIIP